MCKNRGMLSALLAQRLIRVNSASLFDELPPPLPKTFSFDRVSGMMLGLAIGDALGNPSEGETQRLRQLSYGEIRNYVRNPHRGDNLGYPSDDSQMAFWTLEQILEDGRFVPERLLDLFVSRSAFGSGSTVRRALMQRRSGLPWQACGLPSAGNGALMRIAPILIPHLRAPSSELWSDAALCAMLTHNDSAAISSAVAYVRILWELLRCSRVPSVEWWPEMFIRTLRDLEIDESYESRAFSMPGFRGPLWKLLDRELGWAQEKNVSVLEACNRWHSSPYLLETVPCVLYILMRHAEAPTEAIVRAVNDTWDNDTIAAIVGAAIGALHGRQRLPRRWVERLSGITMANDFGRMFRLLQAAERAFML